MEGKLERLVCTAWCIWKNRNAAKFEGKCKQARRIVTEANASVEEFSEYFGALRQPAPPRTGRWAPPSDGWYKVNVDRVMFKESGSCGIWIVIIKQKGRTYGSDEQEDGSTAGSIGSGR